MTLYEFQLWVCAAAGVCWLAYGLCWTRDRIQKWRRDRSRKGRS